jgi:hypothetical protein
MSSLPPAVDGGTAGAIVAPADLASSLLIGQNAASLQSQDSYTVTIDNLPVKLFTKYGFTFSYLYSDPSGTIEGPRSATYFISYTPPNECTEPTNVVLTQGIGSYGITWDKPTFGTYVDTIIYESSSETFDDNSKVVYIGTANQCTVLTGGDYSQRFVKVYYRDKYLHKSPNGTVKGPISGKNSDPDTSTPPAAPTSVNTPTPFIDSYDKSGFSAGVTFSWTANTDSNTSGYVIRWSTQNPVTTQNPIWEYGQVEGKATTSFTVKGLVPNTLYYYQVTAKSPYNAISWVSPYNGTFGPVVDSSAPADAWAQLKSILSIGGKTADLFKIGTGITQPINNSITTTPTMTASLPWSGIILNKSTTDQGNNYWLNTGQFRVGSSTNFLYWDGSNLYTTGKINATGGSFSGDIQLSTGSLYTGTTPNSGARVRFNNGGLYGYDSTSTSDTTGQTFSIDASTGLLYAKKGTVSGWSIDGTTFSQNGAILSSTGYLSLGKASADQIVLSAIDSNYRLWIGNNNGTYGSFKVDKNGVLYAQGAQISGNVVIGSGATFDQIVAAKKAADDAAAAAAAASGTASSASDTAASALAKANAAVNTANNAYPASNFDKASILKAINASTNGSTLDGGLLTAGTVVADNVVSTYVYAGYISADKINAGTLSADKISGGSITASSVNLTSSSYALNVGTSTDYAYLYISPNAARGMYVNAIGMVGSDKSGTTSHWYPWTNGGFALGLTSPSAFRWSTAYLVNSPNVSSDIRLKKDIKDSDLGLNFIKSLRPVSYKFISGQTDVIKDADGEPEIDENGFIKTKNREGIRTHWGFIAQEVKNAIDLSGVEDFAGWSMDDKTDPDSMQGLRYEQFISPLTKAVQELSNMVESLQQEISELKGK